MGLGVVDGPMAKKEASHVEQLRATLRIQMLATAFTLACLVALVVFAHAFVLRGFVSNPYLNGLIVSVFLLGIFHSVRRLVSVRNDATAFSALEEAYEDARKERTETIQDPYWRHYRAMRPGIVFKIPSSIGHMFEVAHDELLRTRNLKISAGTLQTVAEAIEARHAEQRSLVSYLAGLLVFLGLIGTFIGLMDMVGSVGNIITSLNTSGGDANATMQRLFTDLRVPLDGMALGFSSSLFGLFGSLVIGVLNRFSGRAVTALKNAFEAWLSNIAHLEGGKGTGDVADLARLITDNLMGGGPGENSGRGGGGNAPVSDVGMIAGMAQGFSRMNQGIETLAGLMPRMIDHQSEQTSLLKAMLMGVDRLVGEVTEMREASLATVSGINTTNEHQQEIINLTRITESRLTSGFNGMAHIMEVTGQAYLDGLRRLTAENYETNARLAKLLDVKAAGDRITEIAGSIESKVRTGMGTISGSLERTATVIEHSMQRMATEQAELRQVIIDQRGVGGGNVGISPEFEDKLTNGFSEMSRSIETIFATFSTVMTRGLVQQSAQGGDAAMPSAMAVQGHTVLPEHEPKKPARVEIDHDEMRRRLYNAAAANLRSGSNG
jgi:hypothetical protein